jgi:hypothetical protein
MPLTFGLPNLLPLCGRNRLLPDGRSVLLREIKLTEVWLIDERNLRS